jgi:hypothetical protein
MKFSLLAGLVLAGAVAQSAIITQWNFNSVPADSSTTTGSDVASIGSGTISRIGGTTGTYTTGAGSTDTAATDNTAYHTTTYPAQSTGSGTAGIQFNVSTFGFKNIRVSFDRRYSSSASRWQQLQYSTDGVNYSAFEDFANNEAFPTTPLLMINNKSFNLSTITGLNNNANARFRVVSIFGTTTASGGSVYTTVGSTSVGGAAYGGGGTLRYDMLTVQGDVVPEPASVLALALGGLLVIRRKR